MSISKFFANLVKLILLGPTPSSIKIYLFLGSLPSKEVPQNRVKKQKRESRGNGKINGKFGRDKTPRSSAAV